MSILANDDRYVIWNEYETVYLTIIKKNRKIIIGDFYGDPSVAIIDKTGLYCVVGGCGIIIYYLREPFSEYHYNVKSKQWDEYFRNGDYWVDSIIQVASNSIKVNWDNGEESIIEIKL